MSANAAVISGLYDTGVDDFGNALADGASDTHYVLSTNADGASTVPIVQQGNAFPIVPGPWIDNTATSKWIGPRFNTQSAAGGVYHYDLSFDLTGLNPSTASISGTWTSDNGADTAGLGIYLNGVATGNQQDGNFGTLFAFDINSGFVAGLNTLSFRLNNGGTGYTGLRVQGISGTAAVPEPSAISLVGIGALLLCLRRRK